MDTDSFDNLVASIRQLNLMQKDSNDYRNIFAHLQELDRRKQEPMTKIMGR